MADVQDELTALRAQLAALTARVYELEQKAAQAPPQKAPAVVSPLTITPAAVPPSTPSLAPSAPPPPLRPPTFATPRQRDSEGLESTIGKLWLNRIGIFAILIGVSYFIKYAFDSGWIGPSGRVALGTVAGMAVILWSERFRRKGHAPFSYSLKAVGIGVLYLSLWGAFQVYHLIPAPAAFAAMVLVTASTIILALTQDAQILAAFAMIGGFSTPVLLSTGENHEVVLFSYVLLLDLAILTLVTLKPWRRLLVGSFIGTATMYVGWYADYYRSDERVVTVAFLLAFAAIFSAVPLLTPLDKSHWHRGFPLTLTLLPLVNAGALFLALNPMFQNDTLAFWALGLAAAYLILGSQLKRRTGNEPAVVSLTSQLHVAIAIAFITIAIPLKLDAHWITIGWLIESAVLLTVGVRTGSRFLRYFAACTLSLGIVRVLFIDNFHVHTLIFNSRFATYIVAIAVLAGIVAAGDRFASNRELPAVRAAAIALNVLALVALTLEASDYFSRELLRVAAMHASYQQLEFARRFSYSAIWLAYGTGLMLFGFRKPSAFARWQALVLIAFTIGKVFLYDVSELQQGYRILSFIALGAVLMGISYVYHRDWLELTPAAEVRQTPGQAPSA